MTDIVDRLRFDAARCEATFSKGVASNIEAAIAEIERLRAALRCIADFEQDIYVKDADAISYMRETAKSALVNQQTTDASK